MLTILSVAYPLAPVGLDATGGAEQVLAMLDRALTAAGHRSLVIACEGSAVSGMLIPLPPPATNMDGVARHAAHQACRNRITEAVQRWDIDVIHMHGVDFFEYLPASGPPVLATLHLPPSFYPPEVFRLARPDTFLHCVSAAQRRACPSSPLLLPEIENGVPLDLLAACRVRKREYALALGRICPEKGFHLGLAAANQAGIPLIVCGQLFPYPEHQRYFRMELAPLLERPHRFLGSVGRVRKARLLAGARCLLVPSLVAETSSLVTMEALACGTPVVAFPSGALADLIEDGKTGFLVNDEREMAEAIRRADCLDPNECRRVARERFSADVMVEKYFQLYWQLAATAVPR